MIIGYTAGVFDVFHVGHLAILKAARGMCDRLVVGVTTDRLASARGKSPLVTFQDRIDIVRSIKFVDAAIPQDDMDKLKVCKKLKASIMFVGDDWYEDEKWKNYEVEFQKQGIKIIYFPYTQGISSTQLRQTIAERNFSFLRSNSNESR